MSKPIVFISQFRVKDLAAYERMAPEAVRRLQAEQPQTAAFLHYLNRQDSRLTIVHLFADAEAMDRHLEGAETRGSKRGTSWKGRRRRFTARPVIRRTRPCGGRRSRLAPR
jgi:hypothetical protein